MKFYVNQLVINSVEPEQIFTSVAKPHQHRKMKISRKMRE